jgi:hypothetical protein
MRKLLFFFQWRQEKKYFAGFIRNLDWPYNSTKYYIGFLGSFFGKSVKLSSRYQFVLPLRFLYNFLTLRPKCHHQAKGNVAGRAGPPFYLTSHIHTYKLYIIYSTHIRNTEECRWGTTRLPYMCIFVNARAYLTRDFLACNVQSSKQWSTRTKYVYA